MICSGVRPEYTYMGSMESIAGATIRDPLCHPPSPLGSIPSTSTAALAPSHRDRTAPPPRSLQLSWRVLLPSVLPLQQLHPQQVIRWELRCIILPASQLLSCLQLRLRLCPSVPHQWKRPAAMAMQQAMFMQEIGRQCRTVALGEYTPRQWLPQPKYSVE